MSTPPAYTRLGRARASATRSLTPPTSAVSGRVAAYENVLDRVAGSRSCAT